MDTTGKDFRPHRRDRKLLSLIACMLTLTFLAFFCGEVRVLLHTGLVLIPCLLVAFFLLICLIVRKILLDRAIYHPKIVIDGQQVTVTLRTAGTHVQEYVRERASQLAIQGEIDTYYIPGSWRYIDAYVFGKGPHQAIVMTGGLLSLFVRRKHGDFERFKFVVDHELGHIAGRDTSLLYLARAALFSAPLLIPIKVLLMIMIGWSTVRSAYSDVFPGFLESSTFISPNAIPIRHSASDSFVVLFFVLFSIASLALVCCLYVAVVRHREFLADRFAMINGSDREAGARFMEDLLSGAPLPSSPAHAFHGSLRWHPHTLDRIAQISAGDATTVPERLALVTVVLTLISIRMIIGNTTSPREFTWDDHSLIPGSAAFALLIGFVVDSFLDDGLQRPARQQLKYQTSELIRLFVWTSILAGVLASVAYLGARPTQSFGLQPYAGFESLIDVELTERTLLVFSAPICILAFGLAFIAVSRLQLDIQVPGMGRLLAGSALAILVLWAGGQFTDGMMRSYRSERYAAYWQARVQLVQEGGRRRLSNPYGLDPGIASKRENEDRALLPEELTFMRDQMEHQFQPPFAFVALWQGPLRAGIL